MNKIKTNKFRIAGLVCVTSVFLSNNVPIACAMMSNNNSVASDTSINKKIVTGSESCSCYEKTYDGFKYNGITYRCERQNVHIKRVNSTLKHLNIAKNITVEGTDYTVASIDPWALTDSNVETISLPEDGIDINHSAFERASELKVINNLNKANIISSEKLFFGCSKLISVTLPKNLEIIGKDSFYGCFELTDVIIDKKSVLKKIEKGAFAGCENLIDFSIPVSIEEIDDYAFLGCDKLNPVDLNPSVKLGMNSFSRNCMVTGVELKYDKDLEEKAKKAKAFAENILNNEVQSGRNEDELVTQLEIDRLIYKYIPGATDRPNVVSKEEFDKIIKDGRLVLYRGENHTNEFNYGDFWYYEEMNGIFSTKMFDHAKTYVLSKGAGDVLQFCFTDMSPDKFKIITDIETSKIIEFYKYYNVKECMEYIKGYFGSFKFSLKSGLLGLGVDTMQKRSFIARALGYDVLYDTEVEGKVDGDDFGVIGSQYHVFNRGKLTVCSENI